MKIGLFLIVAVLLQAVFVFALRPQVKSVAGSYSITLHHDDFLGVYLVQTTNTTNQTRIGSFSTRDVDVVDLSIARATTSDQIAVFVLQISQKRTNGGSTVYYPVQKNDEKVISTLRDLGVEVVVVPWNFLDEVSIENASFLWVVHAASNSFSKDMTELLRVEKRPAVVCDPTVIENLGMVGSSSDGQYGSLDTTEIQYLTNEGTVQSTVNVSSKPIILNWGYPAANSIVKVRNPEETAKAYVYAFPPGVVSLGAGTRVGCPIHKPEGEQNALINTNMAEFSTLVKEMVDLAFSPGTAQIHIAVNATNLLFTETDETQVIRAVVTDQFGGIYDVANYDIEWVSTRSDVSITSLSTDSVSVKVNTIVGYSLVIARSKNNPSMISEPVAVLGAVVKTNVAALNPDDVLYPLPPDLPNDTAEDLPDYVSSGSQVVIGGFTLTEILKSYSVEESNDVPLVFSPLIVRTSSLDASPQLVVSKSDIGASGRIKSKNEKGTWTLLVVEAVSPFEIFDKVKLAFNGPELQSKGLYSSVPKPQVSTRIGKLSKSLQYDTNELTDAVKQGGLCKGIPPVLKRFNPKSCVTSGSCDGLRFDLDAVEVKVQRVPPIAEFDFDTSFSEKIYFFIYGGVEVEIQFRPELNLQATAQVELDCGITSELTRELGLSAYTFSLFDFVAKLQGRLIASVEGGFGTRLNAFALFRDSIKVTAGFRYEDGRFWAGDNTVGQYFSFKGLKPLKDQLTPADTGFTFGGRLFGNQEQVDAFVDAKIGPALLFKIDGQLGGVVVNQLNGVLERLARNEALVGVLQKIFAADGRRVIDFLTDLTDLTLVKLEIPIFLSLRYETARKILNEADAGNWLAEEHQSFAIETDPSLTIGVEEIGKFTGKYFGTTWNLAVTLKEPPTEFVHFLKALEPGGNIEHLVQKGSGNSEAELEVGDQVSLKVPGVFGEYDGFGIIDQSDNRPRFCSVYTEQKPGITSPLSSFDRISELQYKGVQNDRHIFEGTVDIDSQDIASYLNDGNELFFLGWNKFKAVDVAGYLNSESGFSLTSVVLEAEEEVTVVAEVDKTARTGINVINKSRKSEDLIAVEFRATTSIRGLTITPSTGVFSANSNNPLELEYQCDDEEDFEGTVTVTGFFKDGDNEIKDDVEVKVKVQCLDVECPLGAIPNPGGPTDCACDSYAGWNVVPNTNTCQCDPNRGFIFNSAAQECDSCSDRDSTKPYYNTETRQCEECPFGAIANPTGVTPCACDSSRGFFITSPDSVNPDTCECKEDTPRYNSATDMCEACPEDRPMYNPTTTLCEKDCTDPAKPFFNPDSLECEACPSQTPTYNADLGVCEAACPGGSGSGNDEPFYGAFQLGSTSGVFTFRREHYRVKDRMQVIYEGRVLHDTGCTGGTENVSISYAGSSTFVIVRVIPNCEGTTGTLWNFSVECPA